MGYTFMMKMTRNIPEPHPKPTAGKAALLLKKQARQGRQQERREGRGKENLYLRNYTCVAKMCRHISNQVNDPRNFKPRNFKSY